LLRFHNASVDWVIANEACDKHGRKRSDAQLFERAQQLTRWHYQWLVVQDFLKTMTVPGMVDKVLLGGPKHYAPRNGEAYMPLEFSVAAYRFGHTMVRAAYDHNRNFWPAWPRGPERVVRSALRLHRQRFTARSHHRQSHLESLWVTRITAMPLERA
jgi:hypothetical protein